MYRSTQAPGELHARNCFQNLQNISFVAGNLISIGPGLYESNHTLDGSARAVYVLNSCEFMHNGRLHSVHFYARSADWIAIQIWRPFGGGSSSDRMKLVYQKYMDVKTHPDIYQVNLQLIFQCNCMQYTTADCQYVNMQIIVVLANVKCYVFLISQTILVISLYYTCRQRTNLAV